MNKKEIEEKILEECLSILPKVGKLPFDKGLVIMREEAWKIADKYGTDGANVFNILFSNYPKAE
ncbi:hypothetical protein FDF74_03440 [Clostridium niameyense]|uniref:Uncharacterized protein n=1 Tax=Clostridium niameyense TaxID=1622073 RepID=A0A6M0R7T0_9CLOT|nr:hypothetical protein [Clostridium niameyense]NEZ46265.1 hypothetical protein [Clostridium niameyense]